MPEFIFRMTLLRMIPLAALWYATFAIIACVVRSKAEPQLNQWETLRDRSRQNKDMTETWPSILFCYAIFWWYALPALGIYWMGMRVTERATIRYKEQQEREREIRQLEQDLLV